MKDKLDFYINGQWVQSESSETIEVINPANEKIIGHVAAGTKEDINKAVIAASDAFQTFQYSSKDDRIELLNNIVSEYENRYQDFVDTITEEMGSPIWLSSAAQAKTGIKNINETLDALKEYEFEKEEGEYILIKEPIGVVGMITPWNSPLLLLAWKLAPALAAGNTAVIKPSEFTSASTLEFMNLIEEAGFPKGVVNTVTGFGIEVGAPLVDHPEVDKIAFTGSDISGQKIYEAAAKKIMPVTLELGGKSPNIVFEDADFEASVMGAISGIFAATGQTCIAGSRLLVQKSIHDKFVNRLVEVAKDANS